MVTVFLGGALASSSTVAFQPKKGRKQMTVDAGRMLVEEIAPRLKTATAYIKPVGCEDKEELYQDGLAMAAHLLENVERQGKKVTPGNIAYYTILHLKSGRRSHSANRTDAYSSGTQLDHQSSMLSLETEVGYDPELDEAIHLGDLLTGSHDDPSTVAGRNLDWEEFIGSHDYRYGVILRDLSVGETMRDAAKDIRLGYSSAIALKNKMEQELREFLGPEAIADSAHAPSWRANIQAGKEKAACKADRVRL
jgi:hypothetical protein